METKKLNILVLSWRGPGHPSAGGAEIVTHEHTRGWVKAGHNVILFTSIFNGGKPDEMLHGVKIIRRGIEVFGVHVAAFFWYLFGNHPRFDVVVDEFHGVPFFTPLYVRVKKVAFIHEVAKEVWWFNPWPKPFNIIPAVIGTVFERFLFNLIYRNTRFMTVSESTRDDLGRWGIPVRNIVVVHNGVQVIDVREKRAEKKTAIYLGALTWDKGIEDAIRVFETINRLESDWQFWVVGKGDPEYVNMLSRRVNQAGLKSKTKFYGFVEEKQKFTLLARARVLVNPSIREGWGLVNIEANGVGTPVAGYRVVGVRDSVKDGVTGLLCDPGDVDQLARNVVAMVNNPEEYAKMNGNAIAWSRNFNWDTARRRSLEVIES